MGRRFFGHGKLRSTQYQLSMGLLLIDGLMQWHNNLLLLILHKTNESVTYVEESRQKIFLVS